MDAAFDDRVRREVGECCTSVAAFDDVACVGEI